MSRGMSGHPSRGPRSVLVMSDLNPSSDVVVRSAARIARRSGAELHVVHALGLRGISMREALVVLDEQYATRTREALEDQLERALPNGFQAVSNTLDYQPAQLAVQYRAREARADLVVVGPEEPRSVSLSGNRRTLAEAAARTGAPVLVVSSAVRWPPRRLLMPLQDADVAAGVLEQAAEWLLSATSVRGSLLRHRRPSVLRVLHLARHRDSWHESRSVIDEQLRAVEDRLLREGNVRVQRYVSWQEAPAKQVVELVRESRTDLLVLPFPASSSRDEAGVEQLREAWKESPSTVLLLPCSRASSDHRTLEAGPVPNAPPQESGPDRPLQMASIGD